MAHGGGPQVHQGTSLRVCEIWVPGGAPILFSRGCGVAHLMGSTVKKQSNNSSNTFTLSLDQFLFICETETGLFFASHGQQLCWVQKEGCLANELFINVLRTVKITDKKNIKSIIKVCCPLRQHILIGFMCSVFNSLCSHFMPTYLSDLTAYRLERTMCAACTTHARAWLREEEAPD